MKEYLALQKKYIEQSYEKLLQADPGIVEKKSKKSGHVKKSLGI